MKNVIFKGGRLVLLAFACLSCSKDIEEQEPDGIKWKTYYHHSNQIKGYGALCPPNTRQYQLSAVVNGYGLLTINFTCDTLKTGQNYTVYLNAWSGSGWDSSSETMNQVTYSNGILNARLGSGYIKNIQITEL